jgi:spermidine synthase
LTLALFCSGGAGLIYQVVWVRQITLVMGSTVGAVATVLATFMGGLGLGSALAARFVDGIPKNRMPRLYAGLDAGIAAFGFVFPFLLRALTPLLAEIYRAGGTSAGLLELSRFATCAVLLLVPTTLMGATLPVLVAFLDIGRAQAGRAGRAAGRLYAANTVGAMLGSLATGVVLLYLVGVTYSNLIAVALNLTAGALVLLSIRALSFGEEETPVTAKPKKKKPKQKTQADIAAPAEISPRVVLTVIALSGLGALMAEVAWTRTVVLLIGPTTYGFSFVVTAVIAGIALGSAVASRWTAVTERPASLLAWV